jgi:hypothetical protein
MFSPVLVSAKPKSPFLKSGKPERMRLKGKLAFKSMHYDRNYAEAPNSEHATTKEAAQSKAVVES